MAPRWPGGAVSPSAGRLAWPVALFVYLALVAAMQAGVSPTVELDQAEQIILAQRLDWGYTNQPPLYTWLVWALAAVTGLPVLALWVIKIGLLGGLVLACDGAARELSLSAAQRRVALAGLALLPAVVWEAQRDLTHSLLAATATAGVLWSALNSLRQPAWWRDARTGLLAAAALLAKHNAMVFLVALPVALALSPVTRGRWRWRSLFTVAAVGALVWLPHGLWLVQHPESLDRTLQKIQGAGGPGGLIAEAAQALLAFFTPWWLLALPMLWQARRASEASRFLGHLALAVAAGLLVFTTALGVDRFSPRWFFPQLFFLPLWLAAATDPAVRGWARRMVTVGAVVAAVAALALPARVLWPSGKPTRQNLPYADLAAALRAQWGGVPTVLLATHHMPGANLKHAWREAPRVLTPVAPWIEPLPAEVLLVAQPADLRDPRVQRWVQARTGHAVSDIAWQGEVAARPWYRPKAEPVVLKWARLSVRPVVPKP